MKWSEKLNACRKRKCVTTCQPAPDCDGKACCEAWGPAVPTGQGNSTPPGPAEPLPTVEGKEMGREQLEMGRKELERKGDGKRGVGEERRWEERSCNREERRWEEGSWRGKEMEEGHKK